MELHAGGIFDPDSPPIEQLAIEEIESPVEGTIRSGKLAGKSMWAAIWILALPVLFQQLMAAGVGLVDKVLAGSLPTKIVVPAMDAISIGSYVGWLIGIAMIGLGIGGQALIARAMGAGSVGEGGLALGQAVALSVIWGAMVGVVMWFCAGPLARMCQLSPEATVFCLQYVHILAYAMPFTGLMMVGAMCMHGAGETTQPSLISVGVNLVNIVVSWALSGVDLQFGSHVLMNPFGFDLHVIGIAAGTSISYVFGGVVTLVMLLRGVKDLRLESRHVPLNWPMSRRIIRIGIPNFFEGLAMWGVNLFVLIFIGEIARKSIGGSDGQGLQGAHIIAVQWEALSFLPGFAMGTAAGALAGQYLGAGNPRMAQRAIMACVGVACAIMGALGILFMTAGEFLTSIISSEPIHLKYTPSLLFIAGIIQVFFAIGMVIRQGIRGAGDAMWPFMITTVSSYVVRLPMAWFFGIHLAWGLEGIWIGLCGELIIRAMMFAARFLHGGWKHLKI